MKLKRKIIRILQKFWFLVKESVSNFIANNDVKFSAALSYYTIFSLAPMLLLALTIGGFVFGQDAVQGHLFKEMNGVIGDEASIQIQNMLAQISLNKNSWIATIIGVGTLLIGATSIFGEIQSSINYIWRIKTKPLKGVAAFFFNRLMSFAMVITIGFLLMVSLAASAIITVLNKQIVNFLPDLSYFIMNIIGNAVSWFIVALLFTLIFKFLPDAVIRLKDAFMGAVFTSFLFLLGKYIISIYLINMANASIYGAAGSLIILLLWVYYSSMLLYFGAEFTKNYAIHVGKGISPNKYSILVRFEETEIDYSGNEKHRINNEVETDQPEEEIRN